MVRKPVVFGQRVPLLEASKRDASTVLVRPENLVITLAANDGNMVGEHGRVDMVHFLGALARVDLTVAAGVGHLPVTVQLPANELPQDLRSERRSWSRLGRFRRSPSDDWLLRAIVAYRHCVRSPCVIIAYGRPSREPSHSQG